PLLHLARLAHGVVRERPPTFARDRVRDAEAEAAVGERENLVSGRRRLVAAGVGDDHDLELETLGRVDRQQPDRVGALLLRDGFELACADRILVADEANESLDVRSAELFVRTREPRELAQIRVAASAVPLREDREVVVMLADDALAETLERQTRRHPREPLVPLPERTQQLRVTLRHRL